MGLILQLTFNALQIGAIYILFAVGVSLIFGVMRIINFAHGEFFSLSGLMVATLIGPLASVLNVPLAVGYIISSLMAIIVVLIVGFLLFRLVLVRFLGDETGGLIVSLGLSMVLQGAYLEIFGGIPRGVPSLVPGTMRIYGASISIDALLVAAVAAVCTCLLIVFFNGPKLGKAIRAVTEDQIAATLQGIDYRRVSTFGFLIGCGLAGIAGALIAPTTMLQASTGADYLLKAFIIIVIGGFGSLPGTIAAGLIVGFVESVSGFYFDATIASLFLFVSVIAILVFRPQGIFGHAS
jgi:branched-chain amino acid transport system permease protein